jgi:stage II sporulation protein D
MRAGPRPVRPALVPALAALLALGLLCPGAEPAGAARRRRSPPPAPPSFSVDSARIEPLAADGTVILDGVGQYRGALELRLGPAGIGAVNHVGLEDYLKGIAEMPAGWPAEALRAQAIAARTYALYVLGKGLAGSAASVGGQICATEGCQVYAGLAKEGSPNGAKWVEAVESTRGQVLLHQGEPILAKYSSSNGGRTIPGGRPYLRAVADPDDARSPLHRWGLGVSYDDVGRALAAPGPVVGVARAGGAIDVAWTAPDGVTGHLVVPVTDFRAKLNAAVPPPPGRTRTVPSTMFSLAADDGARMVTLEGRGYGHGIGMSQYGAYGKAVRGMKADGILAAYYGGIRPVALPPERTPASLRVAIDAGRPEAVVSASGPFRVLDGKGNVVAAVATGAWRAVPGQRGHLRLLPPPGQAGMPQVEVAAIDPPAPAVGQALVVRFRPSIPAYVRVAARPPGGTETEVLAPTPSGAEELSVTLPPASTGPGAYLVSITADAGGGRVTTLPLIPLVAPPPGSPVEPWSPPGAASSQERARVLDRALAQVRHPSAEPASRSSPPASGVADVPPAAPSAADRLASGLALVALTAVAAWRWRLRRLLA